MDHTKDPADPAPAQARTRAVDKPSTTEHKHPAPCESALELAADSGRSLDLLLELAQPEPGDIVVIGCSTSEIQGSRIGSAGSPELAGHLFRELAAVTKRYGVGLAIQCCEHLNRALVVERRTMRDHRLTEVTVIPVWNAGGSLAAAAMDGFDDAVVVETVAAVAGMDIGHTLIGMHLRPVAVPVRLPWKHIGQADLVLARTRPRLIGGARARYSRQDADERSTALAADAKETCR